MIFAALDYWRRSFEGDKKARADEPDVRAAGARQPTLRSVAGPRPSAGAPAELWLARGTVHGFLNIREVVSRREAGLDRVAAYLGAHLGT